MNKAFFMGRITKDIDAKQTASGISVATFSIAVDRKFKNQNGEKETDFFNCVAWRGTADFVSKYFKKGNKILVIGSLQNRSYDDKDGNKRYVTELIVDDAEFCESKRDDSNNANVPDGFIMADDSTSLPFDLN
jgi:single-strand DNA-binding protein